MKGFVPNINNSNKVEVGEVTQVSYIELGVKNEDCDCQNCEECNLKK